MLGETLREVSQSKDVNGHLEKAVVRYCLGLENNQGMRAVAKELDLLRPLLDIKKDRLDISAYLQVDLRHALIDFYTRRLLVRDVLSKHHITLEDLGICVRHTSCRELPRLKQRARCVVSPSRLEWIMVTHIIGYCRTWANRKMKFLHHHPEWKDDYDGQPKPPNYLSPVVAELMTAAWKASRKCLGTSKNESMLIASIKNSVRNHAVNLINQYTTAGRGVLVRTVKGVKGVSYDQFNLMVSSLDAPLANDDSSTFSLGDTIAGNHEDFQELLEKFSLPHAAYRYARLMLGVPDRNFSAWATDFFEEREPLKELPDEDYESVVALYTGMTAQDKEELRNTIATPN